MADDLVLTPADGLRLAFDETLVAGYPSADAVEPGWRLEGQLAPRFASLRVLAGALGDGTLLVLAAARPHGGSHADERAAGAVVAADGTASAIAEALISTEYAADGSIRRLGLELHRPDDDYPLRGAGDALETGSAIAEGLKRRTVRLAFRLDRKVGTGLYEIVEPA